MGQMVIPGIYVTEQQYTLNPLQIDTRCLAAFAGITERGPVHTPVLIKSFDEYLKIFGGFDTAGVLAYSVYTYFKCGGGECIVTRVVHTESARNAEAVLECQKGSLILQARTPGHWGNYITVRTWQENEKMIEQVTLADVPDGAWIEISNIGSICVGDMLQFNFGKGRLVCRQVKKIQGCRIEFNYPLPAFRLHKDSLDEIIISKVFLSLAISCGKQKEQYLHLDMNPEGERYFEAWINSRSNLCTIRSENHAGMVQQIFSMTASGGNDGIADMTAGDFIGSYHCGGHGSGIGTFESRDDITLIAAPDAVWLYSIAGKTDEQKELEYRAVQSALISQAERFADRFAVLDVPDFFEPEQATAWIKKFDSAYAAAYYPAIDVLDPLDPSGARTVRIPPSGGVCGCIACTDKQKGVFYAPANMVIQGAAGVSRRLTDGEQEFLYPAGINILKYFPGKGPKIWGARTLSRDPEWRYINVRRTFSRIVTALKRGTQWAVFEVNDKNLRKRLVRQVSGFLLNLWMKGYLSGTTAEQGYYVRCDEELNPPEQIDNGLLTFEVGIAIVKPAEYFQIQITAEKDGASVYIDDE